MIQRRSRNIETVAGGHGGDRHRFGVDGQEVPRLPSGGIDNADAPRTRSDIACGGGKRRLGCAVDQEIAAVVNGQTVLSSGLAYGQYQVGGRALWDGTTAGSHIQRAA